MRTFFSWRLRLLTMTLLLVAATQCGCGWRRCGAPLVTKIGRPSIFARSSTCDLSVNAEAVTSESVDSRSAANVDPTNADTATGKVEANSNTLELASDNPAVTVDLKGREQDATYYQTPDVALNYDNSQGGTHSEQVDNPAKINAANSLSTGLASVVSPRSSGSQSSDPATSPAKLELPQPESGSPAANGQRGGMTVLDLGNEQIRVEPYNHVVIADQRPLAIVRQMVGPVSGAKANENPIRATEENNRLDQNATRFDQAEQSLPSGHSLLVKNHTVREANLNGAPVAANESKSARDSQPAHDLVAAEAIAPPAWPQAADLTAPATRSYAIQDREVLIDDLPVKRNDEALQKLSATPDTQQRVAESRSEPPLVLSDLPPRFNRRESVGEVAVADNGILLRARADFPYSSSLATAAAQQQLPPPPVRVAARPWNTQYGAPALAGDVLSSAHNGRDGGHGLLASPVRNNVPAQNAAWQFAPLPAAQPTQTPAARADVEFRSLPVERAESRESVRQ